MSDLPQHNKNHPFPASIKDRYSLSVPGSKKNTLHVVIDIKGSGLTYNIGDCLGVYPINDPTLINKTIQAMKATGEEMIRDKHSEEMISVRQFLTLKANITEISRKLLQEIAQRQPNEAKKFSLENLFKNENKELLKHFLDSRELWDILLEHHEVVFTMQELVDMLMPLLPRLYSIASSNMVVGDEVHLTIALLKYESFGHQRKGVCTHYLCDLVPMHQPIIPVYIQPHHGFTLPQDDSKDIIMIGPGTGVAPFKGFMEERSHKNSSGRNWLFFGEWTREFDFYYQDFWKKLESENKLRLSLAFSRDQDHKIYVQQRMLENGADLFEWIKNGAYIYVCGDAKRMAKDVESTLLTIFETHGQMDSKEAAAYLKELRVSKRYLRDVY
jgi:sulfite reductase (NADPH) flavoprotein alpha-component